MISREGSHVGNLVRLNRTWRSVSSKDLAEKAGISSAYLSRIESTKANPSIEVLRRIADALGVPIEGILQDGPGRTSIRSPRPEAVVVRHDGRKTMRPPGSPVVYELLTPDLQRQLEFVLVRHQPGEAVLHFSHEGEESMLCLEGTVGVEVGGEQFVLCPGDCITFDSSIKHAARAIGDQVAVLVSAQAPPSF
jgi:transcriptional regulator with XRE-family HTH domain